MTDFSSHHLISAYVDDRLSPEERAEVEALLESSGEARAEFESYRQLRTILKSLPAEPAPAGFLTQVMAQAEQESLHGKPPAAVAVTEDKGSFRKRWTVPAVSVSVVASLGLLLFVAVQSQHQNHLAVNEPASGIVATTSEADSSELAATGTEPEEARHPLSDVAALSGDQVRLMRQNLDQSEQAPIVPNIGTDGTVSMISSYDLRTAKVGDAIDALQMKGGQVVVVQLTVLDRQRFLDNFHILLSDLNVPQEARGANNYGERRNDFYAVYMQAGEGRFEDLMARLQKDTDVEQMYVSRTIASAELNPYVAEQGYEELWAMKNQDEQPGHGRNSIPREMALNESDAAQATKQSENNRPARRQSAKNKEGDFDDSGAKPELQKEAFRRPIVKADRSEFPPPPPLPLTPEQELTRPVTDLPKTELAKKPAPTESPEDAETGYRERLVVLRLPESLGKRLVAPRQPSAQLSMGNAEAVDRQLVQQNAEVLRQQQLKKEEPLPANRFAGSAAFAGRAAPVDESAAEKSTLAETKAARPSKPGAGAQAGQSDDKSLKRSRERGSRPLQVLFLLTAETPSATQPASPSPPEAKPAPKQ